MLRWKRLLPMIMSVMIVFAMMPVNTGSAYAADNVTIGIFYYQLNEDGTAILTGCGNGLVGGTIKETITYEGAEYTVTAVGDNAFSEIDTLEYITLPKTIKTVGDSAFYNSTIESVTFSEVTELTEIGNDAFKNCRSLSEIKFGGSKSQWSAVYNTQLGIPDGVEITCTCYDLVFDTRGGNEIATQHIPAGKGGKMPDDPTKPGCSFDGWYTDEELTQEFEKTPVESDMILYARWSFSITAGVYDMSSTTPYACGNMQLQYGGSPTFTPPNTGGGYVFREGYSLNLMSYPSDGYYLVGWYKGENINGQAQPIVPLDMDDPDNLISDEENCSFKLDEGMVICAVFDKAQSISDEKVVVDTSSFTYNGSAQRPVVKTIGGKTLTEGKDYTVSFSSTPKNAGTYTMTITGKRYFYGTIKTTFTIGKSANPMTVKGKTVRIKAKKLKKKARTIKRAKAVKVSNAQGTLSYKLVKAKKGGKKIKLRKAKKYFKINANTGKIKVKKKLKKGTYKVTVKVTAAGNSNYNAIAKNVTFKVKIK